MITNPKVGKDIGAAYPNIVMVDPSRKYIGIQFTFNKRFADKWQMSASYTYSKEEGSYSNAHTATGSYGTGATGNYYDPNLQINLYGRSAISPPHVFKIMASYLLPWDINISAVYSTTRAEPGPRRRRSPSSIRPPSPTSCSNPRDPEDGCQQQPRLPAGEILLLSGRRASR